MLRQATATDSADAFAGAAWSPARDWLNTRACRLLRSSSHMLASGVITHTHWPHSAAPHEGPCLKDSDWSTAPARAAASASWTPGGDTMADTLLPSCDSTAAPSALALVYTPVSAFTYFALQSVASSTDHAIISAGRCNVRQPHKSATGRSAAIGVVMCHYEVYKEQDYFCHTVFFIRIARARKGPH
jgi:hypothetical protein